MRTRRDQGTPLGYGPTSARPAGAEAPGLRELFLTSFGRDLRNFLPGATLELIAGDPPDDQEPGDLLRWIEPREPGGSPEAVLFGSRFRVIAPPGRPMTRQDRRLGAAIIAVMSLRYHHLFLGSGPPRPELYRGGSEDHYVAAFLEPAAYAPPPEGRPSRIASAILTLRTAALSTYENHRVTTGVLLLGPGEAPGRPVPVDALPYGVELTALKSLSRLCDGERTVFLVDRHGRLADILAIDGWPAGGDGPVAAEVPCARGYAAHARATREGGHICLALSRHQEIKVFAEGVQAFAFTHGRWRILDSARKFAAWQAALASPILARTLFQAALNLADARRGALIVVLDDPEQAVGRLVALHDRLAGEPQVAPVVDPASNDPLARRTLHYLARDRAVGDLAPAVLEALASLDGALVVDHAGRLVSFGAILRHDPADLPALAFVEGARTTAALAASAFGPVLKVSEDGVISCFLKGQRAWDL